MLDLYKLFRDFRARRTPDKLCHVPSHGARIQWLESAFAADVNDSRLIPHIQLFEFETILFCEPDAFRVLAAGSLQTNDIEELKKIVQGVEHRS